MCVHLACDGSQRQDPEESAEGSGDTTSIMCTALCLSSPLTSLELLLRSLVYSGVVELLNISPVESSESDIDVHSAEANIMVAERWTSSTAADVCRNYKLRIASARPDDIEEA